MLMIQRTMTNRNQKLISSKRSLLLVAECTVMLLLCFNDSVSGLQQRTQRLLSESISSIRGGGVGGSTGSNQHRNLVLFGIVCNICTNNDNNNIILSSSDTFIPGQGMTCSELDNLGKNKSFRRPRCRSLQTDSKIISLCCDDSSSTTTTISPTTSPAPSTSTTKTVSPTISPSLSSSSKTTSPVAVPISTSLTTISTSDSKQGISTGGTVAIIIVVVLVVCAIGYYFIWKNLCQSNNNDNNNNNNDDNESVKQDYFDKEDDAATMGFQSYRNISKYQQKLSLSLQQELKTNEAEQRNEHQHDNDRLPTIISVASTSTNTGITTSAGSTTSIIEEGIVLIEKTILLPCGVLGLVLETDTTQIRQPIIDEIVYDSPIKDYVTVGDIIVSIYGTDTHSMSGQEVAVLLSKTATIPNRTMIVLSSSTTKSNNDTTTTKSTSLYDASTITMSTMQTSSMYTTGTFDKANGQSIISTDNITENDNDTDNNNNNSQSIIIGSDNSNDE